MTGKTNRREALRGELQNGTVRPRSTTAALSASIDALARQRRTPVDDAAAEVCRELWNADRRTLQLLSPQVRAALDRWRETDRVVQVQADEPAALKPRM